MAKLSQNALTVEWRVGVWLKEADLKKFDPVLHVNGDGLVIEYNEKKTGYKKFEKICGLTKNSS